MDAAASIPTSLFSFNFSYWALQTAAMMLTVFILPRLRVSGPLGAFATVVALAFVNSHVWNAALFFSIPDTFSYQVACIFLANGVIFWVLVKILPGIEVDGFLAALFAPVLFSLISLFLSRYATDIDWIRLMQWSLEQLQELQEMLRDQGKVLARPAATPVP